MTSRLTNLSSPFSFQFNVTAAGTPEQLAVKIRVATIAFVPINLSSGAAKATITDSDSGFLVAGFQTGDSITVSGSTSNDGDYVVESVAAGVITLLAKHDLVTEGAAATVKIITGKSVPDGCAVTVKAKHANNGVIHVADSSAKAVNTKTGSFTMLKDEALGLQVTNTTDVWLDSSVSGEGVEVIFERSNQS